jgi:hypothetical protein
MAGRVSHRHQDTVEATSQRIAAPARAVYDRSYANRNRGSIWDCGGMPSSERFAGAIAEPWRQFRKEGNSYFFFSLLAGFAFVVLAALLSLPLIILAIKGRYYLALHRDRLDVYMLLAIAGWVFVILLVIIAWALIASFVVPVMYRRRCRAYEGFRAAVSLIAAHPGEIVLYCLFLILLAITTGLISCCAMCVTCCIAALPYIGTVILLPVYVLLRSFSLVFLRQFGPDYDLWASFRPPEFLTILSGAPPMPPPATSAMNPPAEPPSPHS